MNGNREQCARHGKPVQKPCGGACHEFQEVEGDLCGWSKKILGGWGLWWRLMGQDLQGVGLSWGVVKLDVTGLVLDFVNQGRPHSPRPGKLSIHGPVPPLPLCSLG